MSIQISNEQFQAAQKLHRQRMSDYVEKAALHPTASSAVGSGADPLAASGMLTIAAVVLWSQVTCDLTYTATGRKLKFSGTAWGIGFGGFVSGGGGPFEAPEFFVGRECQFEIHGAAVGGGLANCTWWNDGGAIGTFVAGGGGAFAGVLGGSGVWTYV